MHRKLLITIATVGLFSIASVAQAQTAFPSVKPGYTPNFQYQYGAGVYPSFYHSGPIVPVPQPQVRIYTIEFRRSHFDYWRVFGRTYSAVEAQNYMLYLRRLGFDARIHTHPYL